MVYKIVFKLQRQKNTNDLFWATIARFLDVYIRRQKGVIEGIIYCSETTKLCIRITSSRLKMFVSTLLLIMGLTFGKSVYKLYFTAEEETLNSKISMCWNACQFNIRKMSE